MLFSLNPADPSPKLTNIVCDCFSLQALHDLAVQNHENFSSHVEEFARQLHAENSSSSLTFSSSIDEDNIEEDEGEDEEDDLVDDVVDDDEIVNDTSEKLAVK